jgi:hypothetical protein
MAVLLMARAASIHQNLRWRTEKNERKRQKMKVFLLSKALSQIKEEKNFVFISN